MKCCSCNASGSCQNCVYVKGGRRCRNCAPQNHSRCVNGMSTGMRSFVGNAQPTSSRRARGVSTVASRNGNVAVSSSFLCSASPSLNNSARNSSSQNDNSVRRKEGSQVDLTVPASSPQMDLLVATSSPQERTGPKSKL